MSRNKLYILLSAACAIGYCWIMLSFFWSASDDNDAGVCLFKHFTGIPCPSCGSTRSVLSIIHGDFSGSLALNPFGVILMLILVISPLWILIDVLYQKSSLLNFYNRTELFLKQRYIAVPAILVVLSNWIWNICKGV